MFRMRDGNRCETSVLLHIFLDHIIYSEKASCCQTYSVWTLLEMSALKRQTEMGPEEAARKEKVQEVRENKSCRKHDEYCFCKDEIKRLAVLADGY